MMKNKTINYFINIHLNLLVIIIIIIIILSEKIYIIVNKMIGIIKVLIL